MEIRPVNSADAAAIAEIYNWYVENSIISFEEEPLEESEISGRIQSVDDSNPWLVLEEGESVLAYAYASPWNSRTGYRFAKESSVYVHKDHHGKGYGLALMHSLIDEIRKKPIHVLIAGIALPNSASISLHEKLGFRKIGQFDEVGMKFEKFIDVGYWQLIL